MKCKDCNEEVNKVNTEGICKKCATRKINAKNRHSKYIPIKDLTEKERQRVEKFRKSHAKQKLNEANKSTDNSKKSVNTTSIQEFRKIDFIELMNQFESKISEDVLDDVLDTLDKTYILKDFIVSIGRDDNQQIILDIEQSLNAIERKLQHDWEYNNFQLEDDKKFKSFLIYRRKLKGAIYFWKKVYSSNLVNELKKAWDAYIADPTEKNLLAGDTLESKMKRYQIKTETISTLLNTRKSFIRVFYAVSEQSAREQLTSWLQERNLHEDKSKTTVTEM